MTQSLHSLYASIHNDPGNHRANTLLANFRHQIFHALGDVQTAEYASNLIGKSLQTFVGGSMSPDADVFGTIMGRSQFTGSFSQHWELILQPNEFMNGLRTGGPKNDFLCDAIVVRTADRFSNNCNYVKVAFSQR